MEKENSLEITIKAHSAHRPNMDVHPKMYTMVKELFRLAEISSGKFVITLGARKMGNSQNRGVIKAFGFTKNGLSIILRCQPGGKKTNGILVFDIPEEYQDSSENFFNKLVIASDKFLVLAKQDVLKNKFKAIARIIGDNSFLIKKLSPVTRKKFNKSSVQKGFSLRDDIKLKYHLDILASVELFIEIVDKHKYRFRKNFIDKIQFTKATNKIVVKKIDIQTALLNEPEENLVEKILFISKTIENLLQEKEGIKLDQEIIFEKIKMIEEKNKEYSESIQIFKNKQEKMNEVQNLLLDVDNILNKLDIECLLVKDRQNYNAGELEYLEEEVVVLVSKIEVNLLEINKQDLSLTKLQKDCILLEKEVDGLKKDNMIYSNILIQQKQELIINEEYERIMKLSENIRQKLIKKLAIK